MLSREFADEEGGTNSKTRSAPARKLPRSRPELYRDTTDYDQVDIAVINRGELFECNMGQAVNFNYILRTGNVACHNKRSLLYRIFAERCYHIDWDSDDSFIRLVRSLAERVEGKVRGNGRLDDVLARQVWTREDRRTWEETLHELVRNELADHPQTRNYRTSPLWSALRRGAVRRHHRLNDLAEDLDHGTSRIEYDCEAMSIVRGIIMQMVENKILPGEAAKGNYKKASSYFYTGGFVTWDEKDSPGGHAYILTPLGNIIEATSVEDGYQAPLSGRGSLSDLFNGMPFVSWDGSVYGRFEMDEHQLARDNRDWRLVYMSAFFPRFWVP